MLNNTKINIVFHDAGSSNFFLYWLKANNIKINRAYLKGPAIKIWKTLFPKKKYFPQIDNKIVDCQKLIIGTGWQSDYEKKAMNIAYKNNIFFIAILDHWVNYKERFSYKKLMLNPDELWTFDRYAFQLAKKIFPDIKIKQKINFYLKYNINKIKIGNFNLYKNRLLYLSEPIRNNWTKTNLNEKHLFKLFLKNNSQFLQEKKIFLRLHPSDKPNKYNQIIKENINKFDIVIDKNKNLFRSIGYSHYIVGCETYALVIALKSGKKVFSSLPNYGEAIRIPYNGIRVF